MNIREINWNTVERTGEPGGTKCTTYTCWVYCSTHGTIEHCTTYCIKGMTVVRYNSQRANNRSPTKRIKSPYNKDNKYKEKPRTRGNNGILQ